MKRVTIEMLIEKGRLNGAFDLEIARILNIEGINLIFKHEKIEWECDDKTKEIQDD